MGEGRGHWARVQDACVMPRYLPGLSRAPLGLGVST